MNTEKPKCARLVEYLSELAKLRTKTIRDIHNYKNILWIHEIPQDLKHCYSKSWGIESEVDSDIWLEITKYKEPELPSFPSKCEKWINLDSLKNTEEMPELYQEIIVASVDNESNELIEVNKTLSIADYPDVESAWEKYVEEKWIAWSDLYSKWQKVHHVYSKLFSIYQDQQKLGEEYELVLGLGFLTWKTPKGHITRRHLITGKASLIFEAHLGKFIVRPSADGTQLAVELDMLDITEQPSHIKKVVDEGLLSANDDLWDRSSIDTLITSVTNSLADGGQGDYSPKEVKPTTSITTEKPVVEYAPALILRKRSMRGMELTLKAIEQQIHDKENIPSEFLELCESDGNDGDATDQNEDDVDTTLKDIDTEIYFPLLSNNDQRKIIHTLNLKKGVLVQGPPGTGKSHTITNLICHMLATGKRVLVTAKTPRALQVLHGMLPDEISPLCINLLGSGLEEKMSLEASVKRILNNQDQWNEEEALQSIKEIEKEIYENRKKKAEADVNIRALREKETFKHNICDGEYTGTAAKIALRLRNESDSYSWLEDSIDANQKIPLTIDEIRVLFDDIININSEQEKECKFFTPDPDDLPKSNYLQDLFEKERNYKDIISHKQTLLSSQEGKIMQASSMQPLSDLVISINNLIAAVESIHKRPMPWLETAIFDMLTDKDTPWKDLLKISKEKSIGLKDIAITIDHISVSVPESIDKRKLYHDAVSLKKHFDNGGKLGFGPFKPKAVRTNLYIIKEVKVDGLDCSSSKILGQLIEYLALEQDLHYIWSLWAGKAEKQQSSMVLQLAEIDELHEALESVVTLYDLIETCKKDIHLINGLSHPAWHSTESLNKLIDTCQAVVTKFHLDSVQKELDKINNIFTALSIKNNTHEFVNIICFTFKHRDAAGYSKVLENINELNELKENIKRRDAKLKILSSVAPLLTNNLQRDNEKDIWVNRLGNIKKPWDWRKAKTWLDDFLKEDNLSSLTRQSKRLEEKIRISLSEVAALKAWQFCFSRMEKKHREHLTGWEQSMKKLGKGTGKHAPTHRRNAQKHLNECRDAVPAWIMPLHRVYETVKTAPAIFDVVIVDEASQCGPEALPLMYLGKRILVVGDDKQISPDAVGVNRDQVQMLMKDYLYDFEHADSFDVDNSLFDHGQRRFHNRISLREHFRCMPEIIRFSNDLCYSSSPLIPLRQYSPDRLEPIKTVHVQSGYREGQHSKVINRPEAEALVKTIVDCCNDDQYQDKEMGVIVLQGDAQAYLIESMLLDELGAEEIEERRLICGNAYSFQGDERDVIFISMVAAPNERIGVLNMAADQRRFNVAVSRAKDQIWLFHSVTLNDLSELCLRKRLLKHFSDPISAITHGLGVEAEDLRELAYKANRQIETPPPPFDSWFEVDVALDIASKGYRVIPQYPFAGKSIDLVIEGEKAQLAVECDGDFWHGQDRYESDMERQRMLERCGWQFFRIRECKYNSDPEQTLKPLWSELEKIGISSIYDSHNNDEARDSNEEGDFKKTEESTDVEDDLNSDSGMTSNGENIADVPFEENNNASITSFHKQVKRPFNIQDAIAVKPAILRETIIEILKERPGFSCVKDKMPNYILKKWRIISRGRPLEKFSKKVNNAVSYMDREGFVEKYKSKNNRVRLVHSKSSLF